MAYHSLGKKSLLASAVATAVISSGALYAQETKSNKLEEIIVSATKRDSNLQDLPLSVTAISGADITDLQIVNVTDLDKAVPGLSIRHAGNDPVIIMRGAGAAGTNDVAVPIYVDGLYRPRYGQGLASYLDLQRVEVLRGPQGTLFGRNTLGGLVNLISNQPSTDAVEVGAALTLGNYDLQKFEGFVNVPLGDRVALRVTASDTTRDPYVENIYNDDAGIKDADETYVRGQLRFDLTETFDITLGATYWEDTANGNGDYAYKVLGIPVNPATQQTNGVAGVMDPRQGLRDGWGGGRDQAGTWPQDWTAHTISDPYKVAWDYTPQRDIEETSFTALMNWDMGFASLRANLGWFDYSERRLTDGDLTVNPTEFGRVNPGGDSEIGPGYWQQCWGGTNCGIVAGQEVRSTAYQADINLNSNGDGPLQWTVGLFYYDASDKGDNGGEFVWGYIDATDPSKHSWAHWMYQNVGGTKSTAIYGQAEYAFTEDFRVTAGVRQSKDERDTLEKFIDFGIPYLHEWNPDYYANHLENPGSRFDPWPSYGEAADSERVKADDTHTDWRLAFQYDLSDEVMVYGSGATGYIAGTPRGAGDSSLSDPNEVESYEVGIKSTLLDGSMRINAALYYNDYEGLSTTEFIAVGGTIQSKSAPGGSMTSKGLEVEMFWQATDALNISAGLAMDRSELDEFTEGETRFDEGGVEVDGKRFYVLDGKDARFSPDYTLSLGATYDIEMGSAGRLVPGVYLYHSDDYKTQNVEYFFATEDAYTTVDLRVTWYSSQENGLSVQAFAKNVTDETYKTATTVYSKARAMADFNNPRTYGVRMAYNF